MRAHATALAVLLVFPASLEAQWSVGLSLGIARFFGGAASVVDSTPGEVHPYRPTTVGVSLGHDWGAVSIGLEFSYGSPGLAAEIPGGAFVDTKGIHFVTGSPEVTVQVLRVGSGGALRLGGGGDVTLWSIIDTDDRILVGGHVTAAYEWPVAGRFLGSMQAGVSLSPSLFRANEVDAAFERRMMLRPSVSIGIRYR
ncbi:MAG TPA: hypothetical protein VH113_01050 [Gemmatimonadales bacterium]|jgi:hypothetical protein|nr:hypothetical protein [Gemmatimonadales bacterium]